MVDRSGGPVRTLTADDFEVREDGAVQPITLVQIPVEHRRAIRRSLAAIRSQQHAAAEAARDDVRVFLVFWDQYHIGRSRARCGRARRCAILMTAFGPTDLVAVMDPLTPSSAIEFSRDRRALADRFTRLQGRRGIYLPPRSASRRRSSRR